jgi:hypothetical protein
MPEYKGIVKLERMGSPFVIWRRSVLGYVRRTSPAAHALLVRPRLPAPVAPVAVVQGQVDPLAPAVDPLAPAVPAAAAAPAAGADAIGVPVEDETLLDLTMLFLGVSLQNAHSHHASGVALWAELDRAYSSWLQSNSPALFDTLMELPPLPSERAVDYVMRAQDIQRQLAVVDNVVSPVMLMTIVLRNLNAARSEWPLSLTNTIRSNLDSVKPHELIDKLMGQLERLEAGKAGPEAGELDVAAFAARPQPAVAAADLSALTARIDALAVQMAERQAPASLVNAAGEPVCVTCGKAGHRATRCPKGFGRPGWWGNGAQPRMLSALPPDCQACGPGFLILDALST